MYQYLFYSSLFVVGFCIFIEFYIGNISIRNDSQFNLNSLLNYLINPLVNSFLWNPTILHCNFIFMFIFFSFIYYSLI